MLAWLLRNPTPRRRNQHSQGYYCPLASTTYTACPTGRYALSKAAVCSSCSTGTYQSSTGSSECVSCEAGTFQSSAGSASCATCSAVSTIFFSWLGPRALGCRCLNFLGRNHGGGMLRPAHAGLLLRRWCVFGDGLRRGVVLLGRRRRMRCLLSWILPLDRRGLFVLHLPRRPVRRIHRLRLVRRLPCSKKQPPAHSWRGVVHFFL